MEVDTLSMLSHELKMPLTVLTGNIDVLEKYYDQGKLGQINFSRYIETTRKNCDKLVKMVNNFIDFVHSGEPDAPLACSRVDFPGLVREIVDAVKEGESFAGIEFNIEVSGEIAPIECDIEKIERMFLNLISNSFKYAGSTCKIKIKIENGNGVVKIRFEDDGAGIPKDYAESIFRPFVRLDEHKAKAIEGSGLGLAIVRKIAEQHGGEITLPQTKKGCAFEIVLPHDASDSLYMRQDTHRYSTLKRAIEIELSDC